MFPKTDNNGHIELDNGWVVSVQHYGNQDERDTPFLISGLHCDSTTAEVWAWKDDENLSRQDRYYPSEPLDYQTPEDVEKFIEKVGSF